MLGDDHVGTELGKMEVAVTVGPGLASCQEVATVLEEALLIHAQRTKQYGKGWKRYGWRGALYNARRKVERVWASAWDADPTGLSAEPTDVEDDILDTINYLAMTLVEIRNGNRDGEGSWW